MDLTHIDQQRRDLEQNLVELRQKLRHWHTLDAEYEGLKEEIQLHATASDSAYLETIATTYNADLIDAEEIRKITGLAANTPQSPSQIIRTIDHRQEYVQSSIETLQRRFFDAEAKLEEFDFAASRDANTGLPLTEIHEELDDDDNILSSRVSQPESAQGQLIDSLRKAGLTDEDLHSRPSSSGSLKSIIANNSPIPFPNAIANQEDSHRPPIRKKSVSFTADTKEVTDMVRTNSEEGKKSVSFAAKVAVAPAAPPPDNRSVSFSTTVEEIPTVPTQPSTLPANVAANLEESADSAVQKDLRASFKPGDKVLRLDDDDTVASEHIVIPENESEEDARLRREMLDYHLNEVGHVVAQLELEDDYDYMDDLDYDDDDGSSHFTGSTRPDEEDTPYTSGQSDDEDYDEDEYGRSRKPVITEAYRKQMLDLQARLIGNIGPQPKLEDAEQSGLNPEDVRRLVVLPEKSDEDQSSSREPSEKRSSSKKRVSFAETVDVEDVAVRSVPPTKAVKHELGETVLPSAITSHNTTSSMPTPNALIDLDSVDPLENKILAENLIERPVAQSSRPSVQAPSEDNADPLVQRRELAAEYYRKRNEIVRQQGGFKRDEDEDLLGELMEERDGKVKKVSRFKAARIKG